MLRRGWAGLDLSMLFGVLLELDLAYDATFFFLLCL